MRTCIFEEKCFGQNIDSCLIVVSELNDRILTLKFVNIKQVFKKSKTLELDPFTTKHIIGMSFCSVVKFLDTLSHCDQ